MKMNKVIHINMMGGILGALFTNPRRALDVRVGEENKAGWSVTQIMPHSESNLFMIMLKLLVLVSTLFLFTWGAGYMIVLEKE